MKSNGPIKVGIIGLGRSGYGIHINMIKKVPELYQVVAVTDLIKERAESTASELGCRHHKNIETLLADKEVELVVVASYNYEHAKHATMALKAGKHVLCDKPFGLVVKDVDAMLKEAKKAKKVIAPFQQRRFEKDFQKVKEVIDSGILGEIVHIRICWHGYKRRWDWQTSRKYAGGALNNNGPHPLDHASVLFGKGKPEVWAQAKHYLSSGEAEDHLKVILTGKKNPTVEVELTDVVAYGQERWFVAGTKGGLHGTETNLEWKWLDYSKMPERKLSMESTPDRSYNSEKYDWQTASWQPEGTVQASGAGAAPPVEAVNTFYQGLYDTIKNNKALLIKPEEIRERVALLEKIRKVAGIKAKS